MASSARREQALRPHEQVVERMLEWVAIAVLAINLPLSTLHCAQSADAYVPGFAAAVLAGFWVLLGYAAVRRACGTSARSGLTSSVALGALALLLHPVVQGGAPNAYPPLLHVLGATAAVSPVIGVRFSSLYIPLFAAYVALVRAPVLGLGRAAAEVVLLAISSLLATVTVDLLRNANRSVVNALASVTAAAENEERIRRRAFEREHWNGLVHDKVLGALQLVTGAALPEPPPAARELAAQAAAAFRGDPLASESTVADAVRAHARLLGLDVEVLVDGDLVDPEVRGAVADAAKEALTNVARHSGTHRAQVHGRLDDAGADLVVTDLGVGFDPATAPHGHGITTSLHGRLLSVGGTAEVTSTPGAGTTVHLVRQAPEQPPDEPTGEWQLRTFAPAMIVGALALVMNVAVGAQQWRHDRWLVATALGLVVIVTVTAAATLAAPTGRRWFPIVLAAVAVTALLTADVGPAAALDWRYWYLGALTPAVGAMAFRFKPGAGLAMAALLTVTVCSADAVAGRSFWSCLPGPVPVMFAIGIAGSGIRAAMDRAWQRVTDAEADRAHSMLTAAVAEERSREAVARVAALTDLVGPWLDHIARGARVGDDDRRALDLLAASIRDHLAAPDLLDATLVQALHRARSRGVRVDVVRGAGDTDGDPRNARPYRAVLTEVLRAAQTGSAVRAVWGSALPSSGGTVSLVRRSEPLHNHHLHGLDAAVLALPATQRPLVTRDETSVLLQFPT